MSVEQCVLKGDWRYNQTAVGEWDEAWRWWTWNWWSLPQLDSLDYPELGGEV